MLEVAQQGQRRLGIRHGAGVVRHADAIAMAGKHEWSSSVSWRRRQHRNACVIVG
jgi:hypothetical protein